MGLSDPLDVVDRASTDPFDIPLMNIRIVEDLAQRISIEWFAAIQTQLTINHLVLPVPNDIDLCVGVDLITMDTASIEMLTSTKSHFHLPTLRCIQVQNRHQIHSSPT